MPLAECLELLLMLLDRLAEPLLQLEALSRDRGELLSPHVVLHG
jgi:hypothetical protein